MQNIGFDAEISTNAIPSNTIFNPNQVNEGALFSVKHQLRNLLNCGVETKVDSNNNNKNLGYYTEVNYNNNPNNNNYGFEGHITKNYNNSGKNIGVFLRVDSNHLATDNYGEDFLVYNNKSSFANIGIIGDVEYNDSENINVGINGLVNNNTNATVNMGVWGNAQNSSSNCNIGVAGNAGYGAWTGAANPSAGHGDIGVWGMAAYSTAFDTLHFPHNPIPSSVAGYFDGYLLTTGGLYFPSDSVLKEKVNNIDSVLFKLGKLNPISYYYKSKEFPAMTLPGNLQYGMKSQDVMKIYPEFVQEFINPPIIDQKGKIIYPKVQFKGINYNAFIPLLIKGLNEINKTSDSLKKENNLKNQQIDSLKNALLRIDEKLNNLSNLIDECCNKSKSSENNDNNKSDINTTIKIIQDNTITRNTELYQNIPNPFKKITTFNYFLGIGGFVELEITDQLGRLIVKLVNMNQETGNYSVDWDSANVSPGIYFYSLKVNSLLLVKKAIKIN